MSKKRIAILTGGGDCPGLNAVIRGVTKTALHRFGWEVIGFFDGFQGLVEGRYEKLTSTRVSGILNQGGTILGSSNKANPFSHIVQGNDPACAVDVSDFCVKFCQELGLDALVCVGGDGTMTIAGGLGAKGMQVVGLPKTIDKDLEGTDITFGFDTARSIATEALDRIHTTAASHHRVMVVEVMGRNAGWLALEAGLASGSDVILIPEFPYDLAEVNRVVRQRSRFGKRFSVVVVAEGARPLGGAQVVRKIVADSPDPVRLGGISHVVAAQVEQDTGIESRVTILGHVQRGGTPTAADRVLATQFAVRAVEMVEEGQFNHMVGMQQNQLVAVPLEKVMGRQRLVPPDSPLVRTALAVGASFGCEMSGDY